MKNPESFFYIATILFAGFAAWLPSALALTTDKEQPIHISADTAEHSEQSGITTYSGNVIIEQGTLRIEADQVAVKSSKDVTGKLEVDEITCVGKPAHLQQQITNIDDMANATANRLVYKVAIQQVELFEDANLKKAGQVLTGEHIIYDINEQHIQAKGPVDGSKPPGRVTVIIPPKKKTEPKN